MSTLIVHGECPTAGVKAGALRTEIKGLKIWGVVSEVPRGENNRRSGRPGEKDTGFWNGLASVDTEINLNKCRQELHRSADQGECYSVKDNYVGDIGDFANHGLLRALCGTPVDPVPGMKLGIIWYRNHLVDKYGNEIGYLNPSNGNHQTYQKCDSGLYRELQKLVGRSIEKGEKRTVEDIIASPLLPRETKHYKELIPRQATEASRKQWFNKAVEKTAAADVIFLNPDTGINWKGRAKLRYVHLWELEQLLEGNEGKIVVIYQHAQRTSWFQNNVKRLKCAPLAVQHLWVCTWQTVQKRGYFIAARNDEQREKIEERLAILRKSPWVKKGHFRIERG